MQRTQRICLVLLGCLLAWVGVAATATAQADPAIARVAHLQHGINAAIWFAQSKDYSQGRLRTFITGDDIRLMEELGFDHVRVSIDPVPLLDAGLLGGAARNRAFLDELDLTVQRIVDHHMAVIVDIHPEGPYKTALLTGDSSVEQFERLWRALAAHYSNTDPERVFFEIMNEPEQSDRFRWIGIESAVAAEIRAAAPHHTIIAAGAHWSGIPDLLATEPLPINNVIYTFHDYEPFPFTHQGATWSDQRVRPLRNVPYPSDPDAVKPNIAQAESPDGALFVQEYGMARWNRERIDGTVSFARQWGQAHGVPVYCGEFGVLRTYADPAMRAAWLADMVAVLGKYGIGWAMWDYQTDFGLVTKQNGKTTVDKPIAKALGLHDMNP